VCEPGPSGTEWSENNFVRAILGGSNRRIYERGQTHSFLASGFADGIPGAYRGFTHNSFVPDDHNAFNDGVRVLVGPECGQPLAALAIQCPSASGHTTPAFRCSTLHPPTERSFPIPVHLSSFG
jgi:hypothetical protein